MVTIGMNYQVIPGKEDEFITVCGKVIKIMDEIEGHRETHLFRDVFDRQKFLIVSEWEAEAAFNDFIASDRFRKVTDWGKANILAGRPSHEVYHSGKESD